MTRILRHPSHDNAGPGAWFLTINTHGNRMLFGEVIDGRVQLNVLGRIVRDCWHDVPLHFAHVAPDASIVMPNHLHAVLHLVDSAEGARRHGDRIERFGMPVPGSVATIVRSFKAAATRAIREHTGQQIVVWQPRFWDRRLFGEQSMKRVRRYIADNPIRWEERMRKNGGSPWAREVVCE